MKVVPKDEKYIHVFSSHQSVVEYIKLIIPQNKRLFDSSTGCWVVHNKYTLPIVQLGYTKEGYVDYSSLPESIQIQIASEKKNWTRSSSRAKVFSSGGDVKTSAYATLFLQPDAPQCVVKAAYRALSKEHHPDRGGDEEIFKQITKAYEDLTK